METSVMVTLPLEILLFYWVLSTVSLVAAGVGWILYLRAKQKERNGR